MQTWVVKLSKLCNMRCSYCYEWNELGNPTRMSLQLWRRVLDAAITYNKRLIASGRARPNRPVLIVLHGGEPLVLPTTYLREVLVAFREATSSASGAYQLALQSNLYSVSDEKLALMREFKVALSFSYDVIPGVRLNVLGKPTEEAVARNIHRVRGMGIKLAGIAVLAKHTVERVTEVYDFYAGHGMDMRILPLFDGPEERQSERFMVDHETMIAALDRLFRHWMATGCKVQIRPFDLYFQCALRHMVNLELVKVDRAIQGDHVLLVNVDGSVYRVLDAYDAELSLGNLSSQTIDELHQSEPYAASLVRDRDEYDRHCGGCTYRMACNGQFVYDSRVTFPYEGSCVTAWHCIRFMEQFIRDQGYESEDIASLLATIVEDSVRNHSTAVSATLSAG